jgi:hypothetical protein
MHIKTARVTALILGTGFIAGSSLALPFTEIRIGDKDGFGYDADPNFNSLTGDGGAADRNSDGHLGPNDVLPSLNGGSVVATGSGDDFDNRDGETISGTGFTDQGTSGEEFTDIGLSTSYDASSSGNNVYNANTGSYGSGGPFPSGSSSTLTNQPGFIFDFLVSETDINEGEDVYFNMVFGDYDVTPAAIDLRYFGSFETLGVSPQNNGPNDGLIQGSYATLDFYDVFTKNRFIRTPTTVTNCNGGGCPDWLGRCLS